MSRNHYNFLFIEPTCAYARWAHMHRNLYVCDLTKIQTGPKFTRKKVISQELFNLGSPNLVKAWTWMTSILTLRIRVIGQRSRSRGKKKHYFRSHYTILQVIYKVKGPMDRGQRSAGSGSKGQP